MRVLPVILAVLALAAGTGRAAEAPAAPDPRRQLMAELSALLEREPGHHGALHHGARTLVALQEDDSALAWLDRLAAAGFSDELDPDDFGPLAGTEGFRLRAARFAAAAPPVGHARLRCELQARDILPEGTAWDPKRNEVLISSGRRRTVLAVDPAGACREVVPPADGGLLAVLGMSVDPASDSLWVVSSAAPFMERRSPGGDSGATLARIDLARGKVAASFSLAGAVMLNDLTLDPDGSVYLTESLGGAVYRLAPGQSGLQVILPGGTFESPNGIVRLATGELLIADFHGLHLVADPGGGKPRATRLSTPDGLYLGGIDGLARFGNRVVGIQNLIGRSRLWLLEIEPQTSRVTGAWLLLRGHPDFRSPATGVVVGQRFLFIADPRLQSALPDGTVSPLPAGRTGHRLLELDLNASE